MSLAVDYLVVGSGLTGATIARRLTDEGRDVVVLERRDHLGGNVHDQVHRSTGIRYHTYGPHYFRTNSERIWEFVNRFVEWYPFEARLMSYVDGRMEHWPIQEEYIRREVSRAETPQGTIFQSKPSNFEEACLDMMPRLVYEKFVKGYTEKQWGVPCTTLSASLAGRFTVHRGDTRLKDAKYQALPYGGYAALMEKMLEEITVYHDDYLQHPEDFYARKVIFTGPIDEFYGFDLGKLKYRGQRRATLAISTPERLQPTIQVNYSQYATAFIRRLEWNHLQEPGFQDRGTSLITEETPYTPEKPTDYEYPFPDETNQALYQRYRLRAKADDKLVMAGRLGAFSYMDMDAAVGRALKLADELLK